MKYALLCSDLDGTLLSSKDDVSEFTIQQIQRIKATIPVILVSARMPNGMRYIQERLGIANQPLICYNGALVLDGTTPLLSVTIPSTILWKIQELASPLAIDLGLYMGDEWYAPKTSERIAKEVKYTRTDVVLQPTEKSLHHLATKGAHKVMLMCTKASADTIMPLLVAALGAQIHIYRSNDTLIELAPKSVSKRSAIALLLAPTDTMDGVIAFGDNYNDIEMLTAAGCGVAVANARPEVLAIADHITLSNTKSGVAHFIQEHVHI